MIAPTTTRNDFDVREFPHYPGVVSTLVDLLRHRAAERPDARAYTFLVDGEQESASITYAGLDRQARAVAAELGRRGAAGERVLLLYPPGLEFVAAFFGCLYAGAVGVPANPPQSNKQVPRLQAIVADAEANYILTTGALLSRVERAFAESARMAACEWLVTEQIGESLAGEWREPALGGDTLAYLQYTSGSTSAPKGVMVTHDNVLHNMACLDHAFSHPAGSVFVTWLPHFHDMGLIYGVLEPVFKGFPCYMLPPAAMVQQPFRWLKAISRYGATHSVGPNFAYEHCVQKVRPEQLAELDLSSWRVAINGAEPVRKRTIERFVETFGPRGFRRTTFCPGYGLAEASLMVTGTLKEDDPVYISVRSSSLKQNRAVEAREGEPGVQTLVSSGYAALDTRVAIVDHESFIECAEGEVGEVWVAGRSVTRGYWNRPEETERTFRARLAPTGEGPFMRTGDLGFIKDEHLYITGRVKDLIIIAGRNHYPQDIEQTAEESHPAIRSGCSAAFSVDVDGDEKLIVVAEIDHRYAPAEPAQVLPDDRAATAPAMKSRGHAPLDGEAVIRAIRQAVVAQNEVLPHAVMLLKAGSIPKTSSGKIQRHACAAGFVGGTLEVWGKKADRSCKA